MYTDNPFRDAEERERQEERWLSRRPVCCGCRQPIQDDDMYRIDNDCFCEDCFLGTFRVTITED